MGGAGRRHRKVVFGVGVEEMEEVMGMNRHTVGLSGIAGLAVLAAMSSAGTKVKRPMRRYREPLGPPYPETRQQRRAMMRARDKALAAIAQTQDGDNQ